MNMIIGWFDWCNWFCTEVFGLLLQFKKSLGSVRELRFTTVRPRQRL